MAVKNIFIVGGGGHAKSLIAVIEKCKGFTVIGYTDIRDRGPILGVSWIGTDENWKTIQKKYKSSAAIGIGSVDISDKRESIAKQLTALGLELPAIVSPTAIVNEDVRIGAGTVIFDGAIINSGTRIGEGCILNTGCIVDHDCVIGDFVHLAPGTVLSGGVKVGNNCLLGTASKVIEYRTIHQNCLVGAGAVVTQDINKPGTYVGVPARRMKA